MCPRVELHERTAEGVADENVRRTTARGLEHLAELVHHASAVPGPRPRIATAVPGAVVSKDAPKARDLGQNLDPKRC